MDEPATLALKSHLIERVMRYWDEVDTRWGDDAHNYFVEDGLFQSENISLRGRDEIKAFYGWRRGRGERVSRHLVANAYVTIEAADRATVHYVMVLYAVDGVPVLPVSSPNVISDVKETFVRRGDIWLIEKKLFNGLFKGDVPATVMPKDVLEAHRKRPE